MKLVDNNAMGIYVDAEFIKTLTTPELVDAEINRVSMGDFEPVRRDNNTVVPPDEYIQYLNIRRGQLYTQLEQQLHARNTQSHTIVANNELIDAGTPAALDTELAELKLKVMRQDDIIKRLLDVAKRGTDSNNDHGFVTHDDNVYYDGVLPDGDSGTAAIKGPLREYIKSISGDRKISEFINTAVARGLLGDDRARVEIDNFYGEGTFDEFLVSLGGES